MIKEWLGKINVKLLLIIGLTVVAAIAAVVIFSNIGKSKPARSAELEVNHPESRLAELMTASNEEEALPKRKAYPIGRWDMEIPYLNPFGSQNNYRSVTFAANQAEELRYVDDSNMETVRRTGGDSWQMQVDWDDETVNPLDDLIMYVMELGGEYYRGAEDQWIIHAQDGDNNNWWGITTSSGKGYKLNVYKERQLRAGEQVTFKTSDFENNEIYFMTKNTGHKYQSLKVELPEGEVQVGGRNSFEQGRYTRSLQYSQSVLAYKSNQYTFNDIPQDTSSPIQWTVRWNDKTNPQEIAVTLYEGEELSPIADGEALGALKIRGDMPGVVKVNMPGGITISHPELNLRGDKTLEGDTLFWLPSGYWNVTFEPDKTQSVAKTLNARLVPVHSGEMTILDFKQLVSSSYSNSEAGTTDGAEQQIMITGIKNESKQVEVAFTLFDSQNRDFTPDLKNTEILEGGKLGKLLKLQRVQTPPSVVLVLDSSGSMEGSMDAVLNSARAFISGLPDDAHIQVIDFDTEIRLLDGINKQTVLNSLGTVKALGATKLYDSIIEGLQLLEGKERPSLVVFTDGVDSNTEGSSSGSKASGQEVERVVSESDIPLYTIGFGAGHDPDVLQQLAAISEGAYYSAEDADVLDRVFAAIHDRLGNHYTAVYERPEEASSSDVPVISLTLDVSGSMDVDPESGNGDYRLDKVKNLFHPFIGQTPEHSLLQLISFSDNVQVDQVFTQRRAEILQALGELRALSATNILSSVELTYKSLEKIPSNKKVMVYLTDAALDVPDDDKEYFSRMLEGIKDEGIVTLWVGLGMEESKEAFRWAAEKSGGKYIITEDADLLSTALQEVLDSAQQKPDENVTLSLSVHDTSRGEKERHYTASQLTDFPALKSSNDIIQLNPLTYETGIKLVQYETDTASLITGNDIPGEDVQIYKRMPVNVIQRNEAMEMTTHEMYYMKRLKGVDAPRGKSFLAIDLSLKNIHPEGVLYMIPDIASHFFVAINGTGSYPASTATWLTETPLAPPGENGVSIKADETLRGALVFLVPDEAAQQAAIHFYDTTHSHINVALLGNLQIEDIQLTSLPTKLTGKLSDTFNMTMIASTELDTIEDIALKDKNSVYKVLEAEMNSQVQALLSLNPQERFYLRMNTESGPFMVPMNTATALLPYGFLRPVMMGPGSSNKVRLAFQTPRALAQQPQELYADLNGGAMILAVDGKSGEKEQTVVTEKTAASSSAATTLYQGDGVALQVNALARTTLGWKGSADYVVADVTLTDEADGYGTSGFRHTFMLTSGEGGGQSSAQSASQSDNQSGNSSANAQEPVIIQPDSITDELLLGIDKDWAVFDGRSRRGLLLFAIPASHKDEKWVLRSSLFSTLNQPLTQASYSESSLLVRQENPPLDEKFNTQLSLALSTVINKYNATKVNQSSVNVDRDNAEARSVLAPLPMVYGLQKLSEVQTFEQFQQLITSVKWLPSSDRDWTIYRHSPEAVLSQGWGTEGDLAKLTGGLLAKMGFKPSLRKVTVTNKGREALQTLGAVDEAMTETLPAWSYRDQDGKNRLLVVPFMKDLSELSGLVFLPGGQEVYTLSSEKAGISVYYKVEPLESQGLNSMFGAISSALSGEGGKSKPAIQEIRMLQTELPLEQLSNEPLDLRVGSENGLYKAVLENQTIQVIGDKNLDPNQYKVVGVRIEVQLRSGKQVHETSLGEGEEIYGTFHTLAVNLPDMTLEATSALQKAADQSYRAVVKPDDQSALIWYTRNILYRFVVNQTTYEKELADQLETTVGRTGKERVIVVTVRHKGEQASLHTSIDLVQSANELHRSTEQSARAFHIMSGLFASRLEGEVLPGNKADFIEIWSRSPDDANLWLSLPNTRKDDLAYMEELGLPDILVQRAKDSPKALLIPTKSTRIYGENRWAWLEIDPKTYETIAVIDTGEHGGFAEYIMNLQPVSPTGEDYQAFMAGSFLGVATSVWSVSSFSLILDDYDEIMAAAAAYTMALGEVLSGMMDQKDLPKLEYNMSPVKFKLEDADFDYLAKYFEEVQLGKEAKLGQDILGFTLGFKSGAAYYFKRAQGE